MRECQKCGNEHPGMSKYCPKCFDQLKEELSVCTICKIPLALPVNPGNIYRLERQGGHYCKRCAPKKGVDMRRKNASPKKCRRCGKEFSGVSNKQVCDNCEAVISELYSICVVCRETLNPITIGQAVSQFFRDKPRVCRKCAAERRGRKINAAKLSTAQIEEIRYKDLRQYATEHTNIVPKDLSLCAFMCSRYGINYGKLDEEAINYNSLGEWLDKLEAERKANPRAKVRHGWEVHHGA